MFLLSSLWLKHKTTYAVAENVTLPRTDVIARRKVRTLDIIQNGSHHRQGAQDLCKLTLLTTI